MNSVRVIFWQGWFIIEDCVLSSCRAVSLRVACRVSGIWIYVSVVLYRTWISRVALTSMKIKQGNCFCRTGYGPTHRVCSDVKKYDIYVNTARNNVLQPNNNSLFGSKLIINLWNQIHRNVVRNSALLLTEVVRSIGVTDRCICVCVCLADQFWTDPKPKCICVCCRSVLNWSKTEIDTTIWIFKEQTIWTHI